MNAADQIQKSILELADWRGEMYRKIRTLINDSDLNLIENWKWSTAVWTYNGKNICAIGVFKECVGLNFFYGALIKDSKSIFNASLDAKKSRMIKFFQGDNIPAQDIIDFILESIKSIN